MGAVMNPSLASVVRTRYWTIAAARGACVVWLVLIGHSVVMQLLGLVSQITSGFLQPNNYLNVFLEPLPPLIVPIAALFACKPVVTRLLPLPRPACPSCAYAITNPEAARCPECGLQLSA